MRDQRHKADYELAEIIAQSLAETQIAAVKHVCGRIDEVLRQVVAPS